MKIPGIVFSLLFCTSLAALPQYSFSAARTCDNCHSTPFANSRQKEWTNPALPSRKCNMSCQTCHVNPAGGGLRTAPGRYFAKSSLAVFNSQKRPYHDTKPERNLGAMMDFLGGPEKKSETGKQSYASVSGLNPAPPENENSAHFFYGDDIFSFGYPLNAGSEQSEYAFDRSRYGTLNADPFFTLGADARLAALYGDIAAVFPMQFDVGAALHPVEHVTVSATGGVQGRTSGFKETLTKEDRNERVKLQNGFVMLHEFPMMSYLMAGRFLPEFGLRGDDHTAFGRRQFEMDNSFSNYNVQGVQIGAAPNYPYVSAAGFQTVDQDGKETGTGFSGNLAWRDIVWGLGLSYLQKNRKYADGGNLQAASLNGYYNLWGLFPKMRYSNPILLQFEANVGKKPRTSSHDKLYSTWLTQLDYFIYNGMTLRLYYQYYDEDWEVKNDGQNRFGWGFDFNLIPGLRLTTDIRETWLSNGKITGEMIVFLHGYL